MAEASVEIPIIGVKRNATEKISPLNGGAKVLSRYLRASPGSCHDYCKYGRKHGFDAKERIPLRKWIKARKVEGQGLETTVSSADRKMKFVISPKPCQDSETKKHDNLDANKREVSSSSNKETASSVSQEDLSALEGIDVSREEDPDGSNSKLEQSKPSSLPSAAYVETKKGKESQESSTSRKISKIRSKETTKLVLGERKVLVPPSIRLSPKRSLRRVSDITTRNSKNLKGESHLKSQNKVKNSIKPEHTSNEDVPEKTLYVIESTIENRTSEPTQEDVNTTQLSQSSTSTTHSPPSSRKNSRSNVSGSHASRSPPFPSLGKKGLRRTKHETRSTEPPLVSLQSSSSSISPLECLDGKENGLGGTPLQQTEVIEKKKKMVNSKVDQKMIANVKVERRNCTRKVGIVVSDSKSSAAQKLKFSRGTILDLKPADTTPRRLKFRRVKYLGEIQNGKGDIKKASVKSSEAAVAESADFSTKTKPEKVVSRNQNADSSSSTIARRSWRRKGTDEGEAINTITKTSSEKVIWRRQNAEVATRRSFTRREVIRGELSGGNKTNSEKVVLRHQNVAGKKEVRSLFNNVIEETASKLVVTRKSKVKALVGAFETVISLQDAKPAATAGGAS